MKKEYLPSKQFIARVTIIAIVVVIIWGVYQTVIFFKNKSSTTLSTPIKVQVKDVVQKDTNKNGIPDWEESLWGLDPNTNGPSNKEYILAKREALAKDTSVPDALDGDSTSKENEQFAQEFFAVVMSLEQTDNLDDASLQSISEAVGKKIVAEPIDDVYTRGMLVIKNDDQKSITGYGNALKALFIKYEDKNIGDELSFIATALKNNDSGALKSVSNIANSYRAFGQELVKIPVPSTLISIHLDLANNYDKVAKSIDNLTKMLTDPIIGMKGIINYKKYNDALVLDIQALSDNLP